VQRLKVEIECAECIVHRGHAEIVEATKDHAIRFEAMNALFEFLKNQFNPNAVPAYIGTERDRIVRRITHNPDPYSERKRLCNKKALEMLPMAEKIIEDSPNEKARFKKAVLCSIVGNVMEFDIPVHSFRFDDLEELIRESERDLAIDETARIFDLARKAENILYLLDNAGEVAFDTLLVKELKKLGAYVTVVVKASPVLNDATLEDAKYVGMDKIADMIITTGTDSVGLNLKESSEEFLKVYNSADLIIAKGMGYAETVTENSLARPHALLLRTKCNPVAHFFGVSKEKNVAKILP
jgi:uncharacterized protein with ATP-grasp and redox domains